MGRMRNVKVWGKREEQTERAVRKNPAFLRRPGI